MGREWKERVILFALFLSPFLVFFPTLKFDFVTFDDGLHVYQNTRLNPPTLKGVARFWQAPYQGLYVPLTYTVWAVEAALSGPKPNPKHPGWPQISPMGFHLGNLLFHGANVALLFLLLRALSFALVPCVFAALLFAWHPLQVEPVAWISALKDLNSGFFSLLSLLLYVKAFRAEPVRRGLYVGSGVAFVLALFAKPSALMVPVLAGVLDRFFLGRPWRKNWVYWAPGLILTLPFIWITKRLQPDQALDYIPNLLQRLLVALDACTFYLGKLFYPFLLTVNYGRTPGMVLKNPMTPFLLIVPLVIGYLVWRRREWKVGWLGMGVFLLVTLPVLGLIPFYYQKFSTVADRYLYLAMIGPAITCAAILKTPRVWKTAAAIVVIGFLALRSHGQLQMWENNRALIHQIGKMNPNDPDVHYSLAVVLSEESQLPGQTSFYSEMLQLQEEERTEETRLARQREAIFHYEEAIRLNPRHAFAHNNLGMVYHRIGELDKAELHFRRSVEVEPEMAQAQNNLGSTLARQGKLREAMAAFEKAAKLAPTDTNVKGNLSRVQDLLRKGGKG